MSGSQASVAVQKLAIFACVLSNPTFALKHAAIERTSNSRHRCDRPDSAPIRGPRSDVGMAWNLEPLHPCSERGTVVASHSRGVHTSMLGIIGRFARQARQPAMAAATVAIMLPALAAPSVARGPEAIADVAEQVIDAVVNISTSQNVGGRGTQQPQMPND